MAMIIREQVLWTLCPQGRTPTGDLKVSLHVAPRIEVAAGQQPRLSDLASSWAIWAKIVAKAGFGIQLKTGNGQTGPILTAGVKVTSQPRPDVFNALFPETTPVRPYEFKNLKGKTILSYPTARLAQHIERLYGKLGFAAGDDLPGAGDLIAARWPNTDPALGRKPRPTTEQALGRYRVRGPEELSKTPEGLLDVFSLYHRPLLKEEVHSYTKKGPDDPLENASWIGHKKPPKLPNATRLTADTDLHRIAAAVTNYPDLARWCGLIVDFEIPAGQIPTAGVVRLSAFVSRANDGQADPRDVFPVTRCVLAGQDFLAEANPAKMTAGFATLANAGLDLIQLDVDGAGHKAISLGATLPSMRASQVNDDVFAEQPPQPEAAAPSLRTAGLMLAKSRRHADISEKATKSFALDAAVRSNQPPADLDASDLARGFRVDILDVTRPGQTWRSLHARRSHYVFRNGAAFKDQALAQLHWQRDTTKVVGTSDDTHEGFSGTSLISSPDSSVPDVYKLHEGLFIWRGWSLSAPEPFKMLVNDPGDLSGLSEAQQHEKMGAMEGAEVPAGLPLDARFTPAPASLPALRFGRTYRARLRVVDLTGQSKPVSAAAPAVAISPEVTYRRFEPIEAPVVTLVAPGITLGPDAVPFTDIESKPIQGESMGRLALRTYWDKPDRNTKSVVRNLAPPRVTQRFAETHGVCDKDWRPDPGLYDQLGKQDHSFPETAMPSADWLNADPETVTPFAGQTTKYAVSPPNFALPYLPDPYAIGIRARLRSLGNKTWQDVFIPLYDGINNGFPQGWPDKSHPITIEGREDFSAFTYNAVTRTLQVPMPKACRQRVRLSCVLAPDNLDKMAVWPLILKEASGKSIDRVKKLILEGKHWMFTPWREIELVHATQKPLKVPAFTALEIHRDRGQRDAAIDILATPLSGPSTVRLDLDASWSEPDDNAGEIDAKSKPVERLHKQHVLQMPTSRADGFFGDYSREGLVHTLPDTRYRRLSYTLTAVSRFKEFFEKSLRDNEKAMSETSPAKVQWINNTAPPPPPQVVYVIPTFGWLEDKLVKATRRTAGLRVYLDRPWMTTGYNEMLAVILPATNEGVNAGNTPQVTQWGRDPIRISADINAASPPSSSFVLARTSGPVPAPGTGFAKIEGEDLSPDAFAPTSRTNVKVPGQDGLHTLMPHACGFDSDRQLWYADIAIRIPRGSYFPFVRLSVARYQPTSEPDCHVSSSVTCDFMQLSADRILVMLPVGKAGGYAVFLFGDQPKDVKGDEMARIGDVELRIQVRDGDSDPVLGWRDIGQPDRLSRSAAFSKLSANRESLELSDAAELAAARLSTASLSGTSNSGKREAILATQNVAAVTPGGIAGVRIPQNLIWQTFIDAPAAPAGGYRRILVTETELYPNKVVNHEEPPALAPRIVYAEGLEF
ncbi:hypothetical protein [Asticcacaulis sp. AC402]|uniref:hypothetical protein n=1 Tax=Asticcacaulis sp. AC402 TaxID=1282361 RepID=UPI0003C3DC55|nr:hypothetical protein [Asticcacaulis sp. AC402]ESQ74713.1 hypothetical protein ABAC402_12470 [Asticcacaulis sp. AC402]